MKTHLGLRVTQGVDPMPDPTTTLPTDSRFTFGLISDILRSASAPPVQQPTDEQECDRAAGAAIGELLTLVRTYEGQDPH